MNIFKRGTVRCLIFALVTGLGLSALHAETNEGNNAKAVYEQTLAAFMKDKDPKKAQEGFAKSAELAPQYQPPRFNLGIMAGKR